MTKVDVNEVKRLKERLREINRLPLSEIQWTDAGAVLDIPQAWEKTFGYTGLNNCDFVDMDIYLYGIGDDPESRELSDFYKTAIPELEAWQARKAEAKTKLLNELASRYGITTIDCVDIHDALEDFTSHERDNKYFQQKV